MAKNKKYDLVAQNTESIDNPDDWVIFCSGLSNRHSRKKLT